MPRPRVKPQDRLRSARACDACKASKKRCDAEIPCNLCLRKGLGDSCSYTAPRRRRLLTPMRSTGTSAVEADALSTTQQSFSSMNASRSVRTSEESVDDDENNNDYEADHDARLPPTAQEPVMLSCSTGEKVIVGSPAAISFLRFLQKTLKHYVGRSGFTDGRHSRKLFEVVTTDADIANFEDFIPEEEKRVLVNTFLDVSAGILDLFSKEDIAWLLSLPHQQKAREGSPVPQAHRADLASLYLMIAIGAQCRGSSEHSDETKAARYSSVARKMAFEGMLEDPTVNLVRTFLLLAFYMLGACRRNSAFMYIGVASKSADILGLHAAAKFSTLNSSERGVRLRTARSLRVFDIICSSILGRQASSLPLRFVDSPFSETTSHSCLALRAAYELSIILDDIVRAFADDGRLDTSSAETFFQILREWSLALPESLRQRSGSGFAADGISDRRRAVTANIHVAGMYYFGVILVTRQFLVQHIMPQLRGQASPRLRFPERVAENSKVAELSQACVEAATYMVKMCHEAMEARMLWGNMCILKAWIFSAGLVLGFPLLVDTGASVETLEAFHASRDVLGELGRLSPQAAQYHHILTAFSGAITSYRAQVKRERRMSQTLFVEPILSLDAVDSRNRSNVAGGVQTQLPSPDNTTFDDQGIAQDDDTMAYLSDFLTSFSDHGPLIPADDELMLRLFRDEYTMNLVDPMQPGIVDQGGLDLETNLNV